MMVDWLLQITNAVPKTGISGLRKAVRMAEDLYKPPSVPQNIWLSSMDVLHCVKLIADHVSLQDREAMREVQATSQFLIQDPKGLEAYDSPSLLVVWRKSVDIKAADVSQMFQALLPGKHVFFRGPVLKILTTVEFNVMQWNDDRWHVLNFSLVICGTLQVVET
ncbi:hypothetical protein LA080_006781 [Diaporthe eres]|nr:hypothetical protein LA080_006781 [Diaporthe eres]